MEAQIRDTHTLRSQWRTKGMDKSIHIVLDYCKCATSEILDNTTEWRPWKVQITILTSQYSHLISSHKKSFLLMKLLRTKISLYFYSKSLLLHHQCRRLLHILGTWSKLALALNRSSRTKLQRKWGRKQLLPENNKRSVCCQVNRSPLPTTKKGGNFPSPSQPIQKLQTLPLSRVPKGSSADQTTEDKVISIRKASTSVSLLGINWQVTDWRQWGYAMVRTRLGSMVLCAGCRMFQFR